MSGLETIQEHDLIPVSRVNGRVQPALDQSWDHVTKLRWHAGVVFADSGVEASIVTGCYSERDIFGRYRVQSDIYGITIGNGSAVGFDYHGAWDYLNGVSEGARAVRREAMLAVSQSSERTT